MTDLAHLPEWQRLGDHRAAMEGVHMRALFERDADRFARFSLRLDDLLLDYSKNRITPATLELLMALARRAGVEQSRAEMFAGVEINRTEGRAVLHTALRNRGGNPVHAGGADVMPAIRQVLGAMGRFADTVRDGARVGATGRRLRRIVHIGIGGSDLGPAMAVEALRPFGTRALDFRFVSNVDPTDLAEALTGADWRETLFIVASKTFTTQETMTNAASARAWFLEAGGRQADIAHHFVALSANRAAVGEFGIDPDNRFDLWDWVGGRYSIWSAIGLPLAIAIGAAGFADFLDGGYAMDRHFQTAPLATNMPVLLAMLGIWNQNFWGASAIAILPYDQYLSRFPAYLQQADMESNGKTTRRGGGRAAWQTGPILFGEPGTNGQHAFYQLIHQGTRLIPCDFIAACRSHNERGSHQPILLSHCLAQSRALMRGRTRAEAEAQLRAAGRTEADVARLAPHLVFAGNRPTNTLLVDTLTPRALGLLIALYEHKIFVQGVVWDIFSFDQFGVELGKQLAGEILPDLEGDAVSEAHDASTNGLIRHLRSRR